MNLIFNIEATNRTKFITPRNVVIPVCFDITFMITYSKFLTETVPFAINQGRVSGGHFRNISTLSGTWPNFDLKEILHLD